MGSELVPVTDPDTLLEFMRQIARQFQLNYDEAQASLAFDGDQSKILGPRRKANALLVLGLPNRLGLHGLYLLTQGERDELYVAMGFAQAPLERERPDGSFHHGDIYQLGILCRLDARPGSLFDRICERLEAEQAPRVLARRHIAALNELLARRDIAVATAFPSLKATRLLAEGVTFQMSAIYMRDWELKKALEAALYLLALGVKGSVATDGEFLHNMGFRAKLEV